MPLYRKSQNKLTSIKRKKFDLEKEVQEITENNLETIFGLQFVSTEFQLNNLRIDTVAFDPEVNAFVIIEYKKSRSFSVVDQGFAYLSLMLNNKAAFILEYNENNDDNLKRDSVDWSQSRVIFIANRFTPHQQQAINFQDLPIELWEVQKYENNLISYDQFKTWGTKESMKTFTADETIDKVSKEVKKYTIGDHFNEGWENSRELFEDLRERILDLDDRIKENPVKNYIGYKINNSLLVVIKVQKSKLILELLRVEPKDLKDPEESVYYRKKSYEYYNKHISRFNIKNSEDINYAMFLIKQVYKKFAEEF